jgi:release factor glutamine methyltransferase
LEHLVEKRGQNHPFSILDIGTGSGCMVLALLSRLPQASAVAADISKEALRVASENAQALGLERRVRWVRGNLLEALKREEKFDLIISNPPYIDPVEMDSLDKSVFDFEPRIAIESPKGGTWFHNEIAREGAARLRPGGVLVFEVGNRQARVVSQLVRKTGFYEKPKVFKDLFGFERVVLSRKL